MTAFMLRPFATIATGQATTTCGPGVQPKSPTVAAAFAAIASVQGSACALPAPKAKVVKNVTAIN